MIHKISAMADWTDFNGRMKFLSFISPLFSPSGEEKGYEEISSSGHSHSNTAEE